MRKADFDAAWNGCRKSKLEVVSFNNLSVDANSVSDSLNISSRIVAFVGVNGVGKTGFLKNINAVLKGGAINPRIPVASIVGEFRGAIFTVSELTKAPEPLEVNFVDVSAEVHRIKMFYERQVDLDEILGQVALHKLNSSDLGLYKYVARLPYSSVGFREVEAPVSSSIEDGGPDEDEVFPFFEVSTGQVSYNCLNMGLGEFCACYLLWRLKRSEKGAVFLLDEPDSHLSPPSRRALIDAIAYLCHEKKMWVGLTTHTVEMLEPLKESEVFLISSEDLLTRPHVYVSEKRRDAVRELGLLQSRTLLIVVEDVDSKAAVWSLINKWGRGISSSVDVAIVYEGANDVKSFVNKFPKDAVICKAIAILDGDKRTGNANEHFFDYLPGLHDPVQCARSFALKDCSYLSSMIGVDCDALNRVLKRLEYVDHHDFISKLIDELQLSGRTVQDVRIALMNQWLQSPEVLAEGPTLVEKIVGYLDEPRK